MRRRIQGKMQEKLLAAALACVCLTVFTSGCGEAPAVSLPEEVVLLDPVGVGESYETAARRNLYDANVYNGLICPYVEEYSLENSMPFNSYAAFPGDEVKKGQTLIHTNTESLEKQIEDMEKSIAQKEEEFQEYCEKTQESLEKYREDESFWGQAVENWAKEKPEKDAPTEEDTSGENSVEGKLSYEKWDSDNQFYETRYRNALIGREMLEEQLKQRTELYQLDKEYEQLLLRRLHREKDNSTVLSQQEGVVVNIRILNRSNYMDAGSPMAAVADTDRKVLKCDFINKTVINNAEQVYAVINGKRYEVEYEPMESEEYKRLEKEKGKVYTTFYLPEEARDVELGSYAVVVVINREERDVLSVPKEAVQKAEDIYYVYVLKDGERVYTPVVTGRQDGVYTEILSGIEEGDKVLTEKESSEEGGTVVLGMGSVGNEFSGTGVLIYPASEWITCPDIHGTVYFEELTVELYQQVKKGDVLFKIRVKSDEVELERNERALMRQRERLADLENKGLEENRSAIEQARETVAELEKLVEEIKADSCMTEVRAPYDGIVMNLSNELWVNTLKEGDLLQQNQALIALAEKDSNYIAVDDENGLLTYGNEARIEYTSPDGTVRETTGMVVTLNQASISADLFEESHTLVRVSGEDVGDMAGSIYSSEGRWGLSRFTVTVTTRKMENVLLVPKKAVLSYGGVTYVKLKQEDGTVLYQSFVAGGSDSTNYWVAEGLTEGMEVCIE